jgi:hypothetical protein
MGSIPYFIEGETLFSPERPRRIISMKASEVNKKGKNITDPALGF